MIHAKMARLDVKALVAVKAAFGLGERTRTLLASSRHA